MERSGSTFDECAKRIKSVLESRGYTACNGAGWADSIELKHLYWTPALQQEIALNFQVLFNAALIR